MVVPFSNSKLRVPVGFQSLLVGLSTEVLRSQPRNIHEFAANYFENLLRRREQGHSHASDQQSSLEDRYYNNRTFQEDYSVNRPDLNDAATKIQAQYRGHHTRESLRQMKDDNKQMIDDEEHHDVEKKRETHHGLTRISPDDHDQRASPRERNPAETPDVHNHRKQFGQEPFEEELEPSTTHNQFGHFQATRVGAAAALGQDEQDESDADEENWTRAQQQHSPNRMDSDRRAQIDFGDQDEVDHVDQSQRSSRSTEHFDNHPEQSDLPSFRDDDQEMNDNTDRTKAATRIQASYRGYKIRKELGSNSGHSYSTHEHHPSSVSPRHDDDYDSARSKNILSPSAEGNKVPANEHDDNAAAVKIQAAYRGYRVRKDLEK